MMQTIKRLCGRCKEQSVINDGLKHQPVFSVSSVVRAHGKKRFHFYTDLLATRPSHDGHLQHSRVIPWQFPSFASFILRAQPLLISLTKELISGCGMWYYIVPTRLFLQPVCTSQRTRSVLQCIFDLSSSHRSNTTP